MEAIGMSGSIKSKRRTKMGKDKDKELTDEEAGIITDLMVRILMGEISDEDAKDIYGVEVGHF